MSTAAELAGLHLGMLDADGTEVTPMTADGARDRGARRFPAHLDTRPGDVDWWHGSERYSRDEPSFTFDRDRDLRDTWRRSAGTPEDHVVPCPGDTPAARRAELRRSALRREAAERERRFLVGEFRTLATEPPCTCPPGCEYAEPLGENPGNEDLGHAPGRPCRCDVS
ncbi:hypothetical protein SAMN05661080_03472 [Modestobacter sp. DSM 44400]|uniref:hypothetical protein n=1 Tax=Modestobacter sp. DSM 44400 TaxID=1550230 RepID=UPI00089D15D0|nr:hypothetical protein [Modestobacter sp. DSM 44400]SDY43370.1 hypothetical protein SAMN05661080_03472 [Modestobacter sp. DSM 44400]